jgi:hypothetical protein
MPWCYLDVISADRPESFEWAFSAQSFEYLRKFGSNMIEMSTKRN